MNRLGPFLSLLADVQDANVGVYDGRAGDTLSVVRPSGEDASFAISGRGRSLPGGEQVQDEDVIVLYAPAATVTALGGEAGYGELALRLDDPRPGAARAAVEAVRGYLRTVPGFAGFSNLPAIRVPEQADRGQIAVPERVRLSSWRRRSPCRGRR